MNTLAIKVGSTIQDGAAHVVSIDDKRITVARTATGSTVNVSRRLVEKTRARFAAGELIAVHANGSQGGISYTSTVEHTVLAAIGGNITKDGRHWRREG